MASCVSPMLVRGTTLKDDKAVRHIAILDCDKTVPSIRSKYGTYYSARFTGLLEAAAERLGVSHLVRFSSYDVIAGHYPEPSRIDAILITGSIAAAYDGDFWIRSLGSFIEHIYICHPQVRIFGACFGYQLICQTLLGCHGVSVERDPQGYEFGVQTIMLNQTLVDHFPCLSQLGNSESALKHDPAKLRLQMCHGDHVVLPKPAAELPKSWMNIGSSAHCEVQGLYEPSRVLTLQPHFEFNQFMMEESIRYFFTGEKGLSPAQLDEAIAATRKEDDAHVTAEWILSFLIDFK